MSRNSKNARLIKQAKERAIARQGRAKTEATGEKKPQGRATTPCHGKTKAWWQRGTYAQFIRGGGKAAKRDNADGGENQHS